MLHFIAMIRLCLALIILAGMSLSCNAILNYSPRAIMPSTSLDEGEVEASATVTRLVSQSLPDAARLPSWAEGLGAGMQLGLFDGAFRLGTRMEANLYNSLGLNATFELPKFGPFKIAVVGEGGFSGAREGASEIRSGGSRVLSQDARDYDRLVGGMFAVYPWLLFEANDILTGGVALQAGIRFNEMDFMGDLGIAIGGRAQVDTVGIHVVMGLTYIFEELYLGCGDGDCVFEGWPADVEVPTTQGSVLSQGFVFYLEVGVSIKASLWRVRPPEQEFDEA